MCGRLKALSAVFVALFALLPSIAMAQAKPSAATQAALAYENTDYAGARRLAEPACARGVQSACAVMAMLNFNGFGMPANPMRGRELAATACDAGSQAGCVALGASYQNGLGIGKDPVAAHELYDRACKAGEARGCFRQANLYYDGIGLPADKTRAAALFAKACTLGSGQGCNSLGWFYHTGLVHAKNPVQAAAIYQKGCNLGYGDACRATGFMYLNGTGVAKNPARAAQLYQLACRKNNQQACTDLAKVQQTAASAAPQSAAVTPRAGPSARGAPTARQIQDALVYESVYGVPTVGDQIGMTTRFTDYDSGLSRTTVFGFTTETRFSVSNPRCTAAKAGAYVCSYDLKISNNFGARQSYRASHTFVNRGNVWRSPTYQAALLESARRNATATNERNSQRNCTVQGFGTAEGASLKDERGLPC